MPGPLRFEFPIYVPPEQMTHQQYNIFLRSYNAALQKKICIVLRDYLGEFQDVPYAIVTTGSDGRKEKGPESLVELISITSGTTFDRTLISRLKRIVKDYSGRNLFDDYKDQLEHKDLRRIGTMSYYNENRNLPYPSRIIDSELLYGPYDVHKNAINALALEFLGDDGRRIRERTSDKRREYRQLMVRGFQRFKGEPVVQFDLEKGIAYYAPKIYRTGFKQGPLRFIQFSIVDSLIQYVQETGNSEILHDLPESTQDRFYYFQANNLTSISSEILGILDDSYHFFLWMLHRQQYAYKERKETELDFDPEEIRMRVQLLDKLLPQGVRLIKPSGRIIST